MNQALAHMHYLATCAVRDQDWGLVRGLGSGQVQMRGTRTAVNQALAHMRYLATCAVRDRDWDWAAGWALDRCRCEARGRP